jgi:hypothetical protein
MIMMYSGAALPNLSERAAFPIAGSIRTSKEITQCRFVL